MLCLLKAAIINLHIAPWRAFPIVIFPTVTRYLLVTNYIIVNNVPVPADLTASFRNCIFWGQDGTVEDEVLVDKKGSSIHCKL